MVVGKVNTDRDTKKKEEVDSRTLLKQSLNKKKRNWTEVVPSLTDPFTIKELSDTASVQYDLSRWGRYWGNVLSEWFCYVVIRLDGTKDRYWSPPGVVGNPLRSARDLCAYLNCLVRSDIAEEKNDKRNVATDEFAKAH